MMTACLIAVLGLMIVVPPPGVRLGAQVRMSGEKHIRAGPRRQEWLDNLPFPGGRKGGPGARGDPLETAADIDLFSACLDSGLSTRDAAHVVARVAHPAHRQAWEQTVALLTIGVGPDRAFASMAQVEGLDELAKLAEVSHRSGSALSQGCRSISRELSATAVDHRTAAAERAGVYIALPLATCFLPAFMIIGLAPVVLGLGMKVLGNL